jgi:hypothetical protein
VDVELVAYPGRRGAFDVLLEQLGRAANGRLPATTIELVQAVAPLVHPSGLFRPGELLALMPFVFTR